MISYNFTKKSSQTSTEPKYWNILGLIVPSAKIDAVHNLIKIRKILLVANALGNSTAIEVRGLFTLCRDSRDVKTRLHSTNLTLHFVKSDLTKSKLS